MIEYLCPRCKSGMSCVSTASIPPIIMYKCFSCGYTSKPVTQKVDSIVLPEELRQPDDEKEKWK